MKQRRRDAIQNGNALPAGNSSLFFSQSKVAGQGWRAWTEIEGEHLLALIGEAAKRNIGLTFGCTRDGGSIVVAVLHEGGVEKAYASDGMELHALLEQIGTVLLTL